MKKILVTGAMGFVGTHMIQYLLENTGWQIVTLDRLDTSGNPNRLADILQDPKYNESRTRVRTVFWDLKAELNDLVIKQLNGPFDYIAHLAAGSHVDRSIENPRLFFEDNLMGTINLLEYTRRSGLMPERGRFLYFSTDEVYGPYPMEKEGGYKEWDRLNPNNPYAASKAAAEMAVLAYSNTYQLPCVITNCMNIFGERQHPEKFIPLLIRNILDGKETQIHANEDKTQAGKRHYLHARNVCAAAIWSLEHGNVINRDATTGRYNVVGEEEVDNLQLAHLVHELVNEERQKKGEPATAPLRAQLVSWHSSRPGHDLRYALDGSLLEKAGFTYPKDFKNSLRDVVVWYLNNPEWL